jgi:DNA ligase-4
LIFVAIANGASLAYDLQLLINKGTFDIVKPQWIHDCVSLQSFVSLRKRFVCIIAYCNVVLNIGHLRYFYHASANRMRSEEFNVEEDIQEDTGNDDTSIEPPIVNNSEGDVKFEEDIDPSLAEWLRVGEEKSASEPAIADEGLDTEADNDSDNEDVRVNHEELDEDWSIVKPKSESEASLAYLSVSLSIASVQGG